MRKIQSLLIVLVALSLSAGCAKTGAIRKLKKTGEFSREKVEVSMKELPKFHAKKRFTYLVAWNGIPVGKVTTDVKGVIQFNGRDVYEVVLVTESNKFLSKIYRVEDTYTSYIDTETMSSRHYEASREEGNYRKHLVVKYDFEKKEAEYTNLTDGSVKRYAITGEDVQDPLSAMCYFMTLSVEIGERIEIIVNLNGKNYKVFGVVERADLVRLPELGKFTAFRIQPFASLGGEKVKKGSGWMYFSADANRYPIYGVVKIPFGKVTATLRSVEDIL